MKLVLSPPFCTPMGLDILLEETNGDVNEAIVNWAFILKLVSDNLACNGDCR